MLTFKEFIEKRDIIFYEQLLIEGAWDNFKNNYLAPLTLTASTAGIMVPTLYHKITPDKEQVATPKKEQENITVKTITKTDSDYKPDEIIVKKIVIPKKLIRSAQSNKAKWDKDFEQLKTDHIYDLGYKTHKEKFDQPILLYVVKSEAIHRKYPNAGAYAVPWDKCIVLPETAFEVLPTASSDGKLTKWGAETMAHELRHTTQDLTNPHARKARTFKGDINSNYYNDPSEIGVRVAALKNLITIDNFLYTFDKSVDVNDIKKIIKLAHGDERTLFSYIISDELFKKDAIQNKMPEFTNPKYEKEAKKILNALESVRDHMSRKNHDASSLLYYLYGLHLTNPAEKTEYIQKLLNSYNDVVKSNNKQNKTYT
jgi:hypothetical protein